MTGTMNISLIDQTVEWTSSDESFATVDSSGMITYTGPGTVTVTGTLKNGRSRQFTLTVTEDDPPVPVSIACEQEHSCLRKAPREHS